MTGNFTLMHSEAFAVRWTRHSSAKPGTYLVLAFVSGVQCVDGYNMSAVMGLCVVDDFGNLVQVRA